MKLNSIVSEKLKELCSKQSRTQQFVANKLLIERSAYAKIELGQREITLGFLEKISQIYNIEVSYILNLPCTQINTTNNTGNLS
jgi:transcriptional regulator with XRE-family HTH domain